MRHTVKRETSIGSVGMVIWYVNNRKMERGEEERGGRKKAEVNHFEADRARPTDKGFVDFRETRC